MEKLYRNPVRREELGTGSDRKKVVPESGTQRESCFDATGKAVNIFDYIENICYIK